VKVHTQVKLTVYIFFNLGTRKMGSRKTVAINSLADEIVALCTNKNDDDMKEDLVKYMEDKNISLKGNSLQVDMSSVLSSTPSRGRGRPRECVVFDVSVLSGGELDRKLYGNLWY